MKKYRLTDRHMVEKWRSILIAFSEKLLKKIMDFLL
jgi:hypothetical protein